MPEFMSAMHDVVFKALFVQNPDILRAFLCDILDLPLTDEDHVIVMNPEMAPKSSDGKLTRLDIYVKIANRKFNIEMQISKKGFDVQRVIYYSSQIYIDNLKSGKKYTNLQKTYSVNILGFRYFDCSKYHSSYSFWEDELDEKLPDTMSIHIFELPKVPKTISGGDDKQMWMKLIQAESKEALDMLKTQTENPAIEKAIEVINELNADPSLREQVRQRENALNDYYNDIAVAESEGEAKALERISENMRKNGFTEEQIQAALGNGKRLFK